jgi:hypothetical protein
MLSDEAKKTIDDLSLEQILQEINKGSGSRFQGDKFAYLETRRTLLEQEKDYQRTQQQFSLDAESNQIAKEANKISSKAYRMAVLSVVISILAISFALLSQCTKTL